MEEVIPQTRTELIEEKKHLPAYLFVAGTCLLMLALVGLPYLIAARTGGEDYVFGGFLLNPLDGNAYLAKMYAGWRGDWRFTLPHTSDPGEGAYLYLFYLGLGHLSRITGLSLTLVFHLSRLLSTLVMLLFLYRFMARVIDDRRSLYPAFVLAAFGSGLGWIAVLFGGFSSDFWVAEFYPFLSAYANPHFPLGLGLLLALLTPGERGALQISSHSKGGLWEKLYFTMVAFALGIIQPFGVAVALLLLGVTGFWQGFDQSRQGGDGFFRWIVRAAGTVMDPAGRFLWVLLGGGVVLGYTVVAIRSDPQLSAWNHQLMAPELSLWDPLVSFCPALLAALIGAWAIRRHPSPAQRLLLVCALLGIVLIYLPIGIQRRLLMGYYVSLAALAGVGLSTSFFQRKAGGGIRSLMIIWLVLILFSIPTNLVVLLAGLGGVQARDPALYLTRAEARTLEWLRENTPQDSLVLASPEIGLFIPSHSGRRVIYGHPLETVNAKEEEAAVRSFFQGDLPDNPLQSETFLKERGVDYIFYGNRERLLGELNLDTSVTEVFQSGEVVLYAVEPDR